MASFTKQKWVWNIEMSGCDVTNAGNSERLVERRRLQGRISRADQKETTGLLEINVCTLVGPPETKIYVQNNLNSDFSIICPL